MIRDNIRIYSKRLVFAALILLAAVLQNTGGLLSRITYANIFLIIPAVICISMFEGEIVSMIFGLFGGLLWDSVAGSGHYFHTVFLAVAAFLTSVLIQRIVRNTLLTSVLLDFMILFLHNTIYWIFYVLIKSPDGAGSAYFRFYFVSCILTALSGILIYLIIKPIHRAFRE